MQIPKYLAAFDFDYTIVSDNSDIVVRDLIPSSHPIPDHVKQLYSEENGWTEYMGEVFKILHRIDVTKKEILAAVTSIPEVTGMVTLIQNLIKMNFDVIIISDSNMEFIERWCETNGIDKLIHKVYSNPAHFDEDELLIIQPFHKQTTCSLSQMNLCKGQVLQEHIARRALDGISYDNVFYIGDGSNDYCPIARLGEGDFGCARAGFKLPKLLAESSVVKADTLLWENGVDLLDKIKAKVK
ncbi:Phosphoethanolamine/phosphocholine phosphatase [Pseudolycoriella hygida]|uniref:Phosphoethanolamine/phosphocholine phosphatase n=1 Tax=Pseudolycoriella hygida TaxID=35572 RepID=A0A9Q0MXJ8_9DIPT|nr:Phosphoethanolamine/phosphocholine phosphatase [Pseudolycoriella hygida]